jgi:hypothetical protein
MEKFLQQSVKRAEICIQPLSRAAVQLMFIRDILLARVVRVRRSNFRQLWHMEKPVGVGGLLEESHNRITA